jgi:hypothetical protein
MATTTEVFDPAGGVVFFGDTKIEVIGPISIVREVPDDHPDANVHQIVE